MYKNFVDNIDTEIDIIDNYEKETNHDIQALIMYIKTNCLKIIVNMFILD